MHKNSNPAKKAILPNSLSKRNKMKDYKSETGQQAKADSALKAGQKRVVKRGNSDHRVAPLNHDVAIQKLQNIIMESSEDKQHFKLMQSLPSFNKSKPNFVEHTRGLISQQSKAISNADLCEVYQASPDKDLEEKLGKMTKKEKFLLMAQRGMVKQKGLKERANQIKMEKNGMISETFGHESPLYRQEPKESIIIKKTRQLSQQPVRSAMSQERKSRVGKEKSGLVGLKKESKPEAVEEIDLNLMKPDIGAPRRGMKPHSSKAALKGEPRKNPRSTSTPP